MIRTAPTRRFALLALAGAAFAPGAALACRYLPMSRRRPQMIEEAQAIAAARVISVSRPTGGPSGEKAQVRARVERSLKGAVRRGELIAYEASWFDCTGDKLGYIPRRGRVEALYLQRSGRGWKVTFHEPLATFQNGGEPPKVRG